MTMRSFRDIYYDINLHNNHTLKFLNFSIAFINISKIQKGLSKKNGRVYDGLFSKWEKTFISNIAIPKRKLDFICGRLAAKKAVKQILLKNAYLSTASGREYPPFRDIEIRRTVTGKPVVFIKDGTSRHGSSDYYITISHTQEVAVALVSDKTGCKGVGIDIEKIEERHNSFMDIAFTENEINKLRDILKENGNGKENDKFQEETARYWTIKEAVMKSMGVGVNIDLKDIEVIDIQLQIADVKLKNEAKKRYELLNGNDIKIESARIEGYMISIAFLY